MSNLLKDRLRPAKSLAAVWAALAITAIAPVAVSAQTTLTAVMEAPLRSLDPVITTSYIVRNYGYMVYDTLLAEDAQGQVKPQMLEGWKVSEDGQTYTMTLRENLRWHDGSPVTAEDAVESIKRWIQLDKMGQIMTEFLTKMEVMDDRSFCDAVLFPDRYCAARHGQAQFLALVCHAQGCGTHAGQSGDYFYGGFGTIPICGEGISPRCAGCVREKPGLRAS